MPTPLPLAHFPIASTTDPDEAQAVLSGQLMNLRFLTVRDRHRFRLDMNGLRLGRTAIAFNQFGSETTVDPGRVEETLVVALGLGPPTIVSLDEESIDTTKRWAVCACSRRLLIQRPPGSGVVFIRVGREAIDERLREILDRRPAKPIVFQRSVDVASGVGAQARRLLHFAIDESRRDDTILRNPLLRSSLDDMLLSLVLTLPNNYLGEILEGRRLAAPGIVRRAEEFLEAHATEPITISDVVEACGCSRRALFNAFRKYRGYTPRQFLADSRLHRAHMALRSPSEGDTVASVAEVCGFPHLGRFSEVYRKRFGESPSATLRKAGGA